MHWAETATEPASGQAAGCRVAHASLAGTRNRTQNPPSCPVLRGGKRQQATHMMGKAMSVMPHNIDAAVCKTEQGKGLGSGVCRFT